jgi:hypothetical protein
MKENCCDSNIEIDQFGSVRHITTLNYLFYDVLKNAKTHESYDKNK